MVHDKHSPVKKKVVRGNKASFMTNELSKAIMNRFKIKKKNTKWPSRENLAFKKKRISVRILTKRRKRTTFPELLQMG